MAKRKTPEVITIGGFRWERDHPASAPDRERWVLLLPIVRIYVSDYGQQDQSGGRFKGWRVVCGGPQAEEYESREAAMVAARSTIGREIRYARQSIAREVERGRAMLKIAREAGLEV